MSVSLVNASFAQKDKDKDTKPPEKVIEKGKDKKGDSGRGGDNRGGDKGKEGKKP